MLISLLFVLQTVLAQDTTPNPPPVVDYAMAERVLKTLSANLPGASSRCLNCHAPTARMYSEWGLSAKWTKISCLDRVAKEGEATITPLNRIDCLRTNPADPTSNFSLKRMGLLTTGASKKIFSDLFREAYGETEWQAKFNDFVEKVGMPRGSANQLSDAEFDELLAWVSAGMPFLERILLNADNPQTQCRAQTTPAMTSYIERRKTDSWLTWHQSQMTAFFGCSDSTQPRECFKTKHRGKDIFPLVSEYYFSKGWGQGVRNAQTRILRRLPYLTSFWMRSSFDGRFVANGLLNPDGRSGGAIADLEALLPNTHNRKDIFVEAYYDPTFFPDDSGFVFQSYYNGETQTGICSKSILLDTRVTKITFDEPQCVKDHIRLYQSVAKNMNGSDYLAVSGVFTNDSGGDENYPQNTDPEASWGSRSYLDFYHMQFDGQRYRVDSKSELWTPYAGDWIISPSSDMMSARISGVDSNNKAKQLGYAFYQTQKQADGSYKLEKVANYCSRGGKGLFSTDERFMLFHHYVESSDYAEFGFNSPEDPDFKAYLKTGTSNIYVLDLLTGVQTRLTNVQPGQLAAYAHTRGDNWIYFMVRDPAIQQDYIVATDALLVLSGD